MRYGRKRTRGSVVKEAKRLLKIAVETRNALWGSPEGDRWETARMMIQRLIDHAEGTKLEDMIADDPRYRALDTRRISRA